MKDFKIGDSVRVKDTPNPEWMPKMPPLPDSIFKVDDIQNGKLILSVKGSNAVFICDAKHFELVETPDPKTAFLSELQSLLKRYNAYIFPCGYEVDGLSIVINDKDKIHYDMYEWSTMHDLSANNVFNYEKE